MEEAKVVTVSGFAFENPKVGEEALKEQQAIEYVNKQLNFEDTNSLLMLYNQMVARRMFHTEVGYAYLKGIQDYLMKTDIDPADIESIPVDIDYLVDSNESNDESGSKNEASYKRASDKNNSSIDHTDNIKFKNKEKKLIAKVHKYQKLAITFIVIAVVLVATVVAMFVIANTSNNPTILNYEEVIQDKYSAWEQDLQRREAELNKAKK